VLHFAIAALLFFGCAALAEELLAKGAVIGLYSNKDGHQIAVIRADRISIDHRRMGFFRIGLLPFVAFENVAIEFRDPVEMSNRLSVVHSHFVRTGADGPAEIHGVRFNFPNEKSPRLQASNVHLRADGVWQLFDGVTADVGGTVHFTEATLQTTGPLMGRLSFKSGNVSRAINVFVPSQKIDARLKERESP